MMKNDNLDLVERQWGKCTFWHNTSTQNFEVFGHPLSRYNFRLYNVLGIWVAEMWEYGESSPTLLLSGVPVLHGWGLTELAALIAILHLENTDANIFANPGPEVFRLMSRATLWSETPPEWLVNLETKKSSENFEA